MCNVEYVPRRRGASRPPEPWAGVTTSLQKLASRLYVYGYQGHLTAGQGSEPWAKPGADGHEIQDYWVLDCWRYTGLVAHVVD